MAITYVGSATGTATNGGNVTIDISGLSLEENDIVLVFWDYGSGTNRDLSVSGYTEMFDLFDGSGGINHYGGYKIMGATPDSSITLNGFGIASDASSGIAYCFRGIDTTTPMDATPTTASGANPNRPNSPSITTVTAGAMVISAIAAGTSETVDFDSYMPTGYSELAQATANDSNASFVAVCQKALVGSGAEDPGNWTFGFPNNWTSATVALRPAITTSIKSINGLAYASVKSYNGLAKASIKSINGLE